MSQMESQHLVSLNWSEPLQLCLGLCVAVLLLCPIVRAQGHYKDVARHRPDLPGTWKLVNRLGLLQLASSFDLTAAQRAAWEAKISTLVSILRQTPVFNPPMEAWVEVTTRYYPFDCDVHNCKVDPPDVEVDINLAEICQLPDGRIAGRDSAISTDATVRLNMLDGAGGGQTFIGATMPDGRRIYFIPEEAQRVGAFTLYWYPCGPGLMLAKPDRPVRVPVTREEFILALIREQERPSKEQAEQVAEFERAHAKSVAQRAEEKKKILTSGDKNAIERLKKTEAAWEKADAESAARFAGHLKASSGGDFYKVIVESLRAELARLTPTERASWAWYKRDPNGPPAQSGLVPPNTRDARRLVTANPDYFNRSLPRTEIQLITVSLCSNLSGDWRDVMAGAPAYSRGASQRMAYEFLITADWNRVAQLIK